MSETPIALSYQPSQRLLDPQTPIFHLVPHNKQQQLPTQRIRTVNQLIAPQSTQLIDATNTFDPLYELTNRPDVHLVYLPQHLHGYKSETGCWWWSRENVVFFCVCVWLWQEGLDEDRCPVTIPVCLTPGRIGGYCTCTAVYEGWTGQIRFVWNRDGLIGVKLEGTILVCSSFRCSCKLVFQIIGHITFIYTIYGIV